MQHLKKAKKKSASTQKKSPVTKNPPVTPQTQKPKTQVNDKNNRKITEFFSKR